MDFQCIFEKAKQKFVEKKRKFWLTALFPLKDNSNITEYSYLCYNCENDILPEKISSFFFRWRHLFFPLTIIETGLANIRIHDSLENKHEKGPTNTLKYLYDAKF